MKPDSQQEGSGRAWAKAWAGWALERWEAFPVDVWPRPLVLTAPPTRLDRGFRSEAAKLAFTHGEVTAAIPLPDGLLELLREGESGPRAVPTKRRRPIAPLLITQAHPGRAEFATDRGTRELRAWRLGGPEIGGALWVLDPAIAARCWTPPEPAPPKPFDGLPHRRASAAIESDGLTLHFTFTGSPPEYTEYPAAETVETDQALVVVPIGRNVGPPGPRSAIGFARTVIAKLTRPLGQRVVIDLDASPVTVQGAA